MKRHLKINLLGLTSRPDMRKDIYKTDLRWLWRAAILAITALAFYLRLRYLSLFQYHIDEFFTLAAADFIRQTGLPRYPTGLFYDPGLPYSYLSGSLFWLFGFGEALGRWPAVIFGVLAVVTVYWLGARLLRSELIGVIAALWLALSLESVEWAGRARMISLAQWLALFSAALLWLGLCRYSDRLSPRYSSRYLPQISSRYRLYFAFCYALTLLSHFATVVLMPAWFMAVTALWWAGIIRFRWGWFRDAALLIILFFLALSSGAIFQPPPSLEFQTENQGLAAKIAALVGKFLQIPSDIGHAWAAYSSYFFDLPHGPILLLAFIGLLASLLRLSKGQRRPIDIGALFLGTIFLMTLLVLIFIINPHWQRARYLLMQLQGFFLLLGAHGFRELFAWLSPQLSRRLHFRLRASLWPIAGVAFLALLLPFLTPLENILEGGSGWNRYDQAFGYVRDNMADGDKVMSMHPPASLLYLDQSDYYLVQSSPKLIVRPDGALGDRYSGAIWVETADQFNQTLADSGKIWLVTQEFWLFNSYDSYLQQQILWQMDKLWGEGGVWALASRPNTWPLAREAETPLQAEFEGGARLAGYSADPPQLAPGETIHLTFFWQGNIPYGAKILVHLRDATNNTVAQADHLIYDGKVPTSRWPSLLQNEAGPTDSDMADDNASSDDGAIHTVAIDHNHAVIDLDHAVIGLDHAVIRDGATLVLPPDLAPGRYRILTGFYHPETFARLGVINDQSGESAVILGEWLVK